MSIKILATFLSIGLYLVGLIWLLRCKTSSLFDPLTYCSLALYVSLIMAAVFLNGAQFILIFIYYLIFLFVLAIGLPYRKAYCRQVFSFQSGGTSDALLIISVIVLLLANSLVWIERGIPVFSEDPNKVKTLFYTGGYGIVRRINWGLGQYVIILAVLNLLAKKNTLSVIVFLLASGIQITTGNKGDLLGILFLVGLLSLYKKSDFNSAVKDMSVWLVGLACLPVVLVFAKYADSPTVFLSLVVERLVGFGDLIFYWRLDYLREYFSNLYSAGEYFGHLFNPVMGMLRISEYNLPIGNLMVAYSLPIGESVYSAYGPNTLFYVKGQLFFGPVGGAIYVSFLSLFFCYVRRLLLGLSNASSPVVAGVFFINSLSFSIFGEDSLFLSKVIDLLIILAPLYLLSSLVAFAGRRRCE